MNAFVVVILLSLGAASAIHLQLGYQKGQRYIYNYQVDVFHAVPGGSVKTLGLRVLCQAFVDMFKKTEMQITLANFKVFQVTGNINTKKQQPIAIDEKVVEAMQKILSLPVKVVLKPQDGSIKEVNAHTGDEEWSHNIKRGFVNLLQITPHKLELDQNGKQFVTQQEATAVGDCQVAYVINLYKPDPKKDDQVAKVTKVINYKKCRQRPEFSMNTFYGQWCADCQQSIGFAPYHRSLGQIDHTLEGCQKNGFTIKTTRAIEQHVITPFARSGGQVAATARQILQFVKKDDLKGHASTKLTKTITRTFIAENPEKWARADAEHQKEIALQAEKGIEEMCKAVKDPANQQAGEKFAVVVQLLRKCNKDTLEKQVDKILARQDETERKFCLDALSYVGTSEAFQIIKQRIEDKKITKTAELERMFVGLAAAPRPTFVHINTTWHLCKLTHVWTDIFLARHCLLAFGALVHKINQRPILQQDTQAVTACEEHVKEMMDELVKAQTTQHHMLTYIKALGNAGMIQARKRLETILQDPTKPMFIRIQCVWALRRIAIQARDKTYPCLIAIFANANEHPEVRMAIFLLMLNTEPNFATLQTLVNTVRREITNPLPGPRSNQLLSFVFSHLLALAWHDNVLTKRRSMHARMALRLMPRMDLGMSYSKGMRLAHYSEKFQAGFEFEVNKMDVPEGMLPRNMNARMQFNFLGYKMNAFEFGARIENMDDIIEQVISQVHTRHKRSLWGSVLSWFGEESAPTDEDTEETEKRPTRPPVFARRRHSSKTYRLFENSFTKRPTSRPISNPPVTKQQRMSAYLKLFGDEVKFVEMGQENVIQLASDIADLLLGKKDRIEYATQGVVITISKGAIVINQVLEKAMMVTNGRRVLPTLAGVPLDIQLRTAAAIKVTTVAKIIVEPALMNFWKFQKITANVDIKPRVHVHAHARVGFHTPFLHLGLEMKANVRSDHEHKADVIIENGKKYQLNYNLPQAQRDIIHIKANTEGFVEQLTPKTFEPIVDPIPMEFNKAHLVQLDRTCIGQDFFGVQMCVEGQQVPDIPTFRLQQVPVFPTIGLAEVRVAMVPATGNPTLLQWITTVDKTTEQEDQISGKIMQMASKEVKRQIQYKGAYTKGDQWQLRIDTTVVPEGCENCMFKITVNKNEGLKVQFGGQTQYQITTLPQIQNEGKCLRIQADWTELPAEWKTFLYNWEPMIWHIVQQFAWVRRREQRAKQVVFEFKLTSPMTADLKLEALDVVAARTDLALPLRIDRFPLTIQEIRNQFYAQCIVQDQTIKVFDQLQYQHNIRGGCPYILVQEHRKDKQTRIKLTVKIDEKVQKTVMAVIQQTQQQAKETVQINPDLTILIDGQKQECRHKACQSKLGGATVQVIQTPDEQIQIHVQTKLGLHAIIQGKRIEVYASPLLRGRVRGLCGDADGEQWNEYRDRQDQVQQLQQFIHAWQEKC